jgi:PEP-CTERM motif
MKNTLQDNASARLASKKRSISYIFEVSSLKRLVLMLLLAIALPNIAFADSSSATQNRDGKLARTSADSANALQTKSTVGLAVSIPEPGTLCLLGAGLLGLAVLTRRKLRAKESLSANLVESSGD